MLSRVVLVLVLALASANEEALQQFTNGNKQFSADVYKQMASKHKEKNFLVCPFSAETVLALAQTGAKGRTGEEIRTALHFPNTTKTINSVFKTLLPTLKKNDVSYSFHTANKIFVTDKYPIKTRFTNLATEVYQSSVQNVDFSETVEAAKTMNDWVAQKTQNKIQNLIDSGSLDSDTVAVLINALYFKGEWRKQFKKTLTQKRNFYKSDDVLEVDTMKKRDFHGFYESTELGAKFLEMSFKGDRSAKLVVVLPNDKDGLKALESQIDKVYTSPKFDWEFVEVSLPKFKIETSIDFKKILKKLGVKKAFMRADFSGMAGERGEIHISDVVQKVFISVDENGVEAAAATAVMFHPKSLMEYVGEPKTFVADHPFLFYLKFNDIVIFTGRVVSPSV